MEREGGGEGGGERGRWRESWCLITQREGGGERGRWREKEVERESVPDHTGTGCSVA